MLQKGNIAIPMNNITTHSIYMLLQPAPWFHEHANALWNLHKTQSWWKNRLTSLWSSGLPLKQRVYFMEMQIGCATDWVESSKVIDSLAALCKMWWMIGNSPTLIMDLLIHYNICTKTKCISLSQIS